MCECVNIKQSIVQKQKSQLKKLHKKRHMNGQKKKQMKMCSKLVVIERRQSKIIIRYHFKSIRILKVKKRIDNPNVGKFVEKLELECIAVWRIKSIIILKYYSQLNI